MSAPTPHQHNSRRVIACAVGMLFAFAATQSRAEAYPERPLRFIVPFPPGGSTDIYSRILAPRLGDLLKQPVVIDNRAGAGGALGAELAAAAPGDGYTLWMGQTNNLAIGPAMRKKGNYDPLRDFSPITLLMKAPQVLVVAAGAPYTSVKDLIAAARKNPGSITYATAGVGSSGHICGELLAQVSGTTMTHVPYKGASPAMIDLLARRVSFMATSLTSAVQFVREGKIKPLATTGLTRVRIYPDTPTADESGVPGFDVTSWHGMLGPAKVPRPIVLKLNAAFREIVQRPEVQKLLLTEGGDIALTTPEGFAAFLKDEYTKWAQVVTRAGITAE